MITLQDFDKVNGMQQDGLSRTVAEIYMRHLTTDEFAELWIRVKTSRLAYIMTDYLDAKVEIKRAETGPFVTVTMPTADPIVFTRTEYLTRYGYLMG